MQNTRMGFLNSFLLILWGTLMRFSRFSLSVTPVFPTASKTKPRCSIVQTNEHNLNYVDMKSVRVKIWR